MTEPQKRLKSILSFYCSVDWMAIIKLYKDMSTFNDSILNCHMLLFHSRKYVLTRKISTITLSVCD